MQYKLETKCLVMCSKNMKRINSKCKTIPLLVVSFYMFMASKNVNFIFSSLTIKHSNFVLMKSYWTRYNSKLPGLLVDEWKHILALYFYVKICLSYQQFLGSNQSTCYFSSTEVANHRSLTDHSWRPHRPQSEASHTTVRGLTDQLEASQTTVGGLKDHG